MSTLETFNVEKLIPIVVIMLSKYNGTLNYTKLINILYLADRQSFLETGYSITGDAYVSVKNGLVLSVLYSLIKGRFEDKFQIPWNSRFMTDCYDLRMTCSNIPRGKLSEYEITIINEIDYKFHNYSYIF